MNSPICKCPECNRHTKLNIDKDIILINCQCGYHSTMTINQYIKHSKEGTQSHNSINDDTFKNITNDLNKGNEHLLTYYMEIKNEHISRLNKLKKKLESSYKESNKRNKNILSFMQLLIDNYDGTNEMKNNIVEYCIKIYQCKDSKNIDEVIKYYKEYNIIEKKEINSEEVKTTKIITENTAVNSLLHLKDGRVASCSNDNTIRIYAPSNDYHCEQMIERNSCAILSFCQLDDGTIVSSTLFGGIIIDDYTIEKAHNGLIWKLLSLPHNRIASCSIDKTIKIWCSKPPYIKMPIKILKGHSRDVSSILYIKIILIFPNLYFITQ